MMEDVTVPVDASPTTSQAFNDLHQIEPDMMSEGYQNDACEKEQAEVTMPSTSDNKESPPPAYKEEDAIRQSGDGMELVQWENDEEKILNALREVVRKCTLANPLKRPTAREVLKMLEQIAPKELLSEKFKIAEDDDDGDMKKTK